MRVFDVHYIEDGYQKGPYPVASLQVPLTELSASGVEIVPVVYIENEVFLSSYEYSLDELPKLLYEEIGRVLVENGWTEPIEEIQIDCDWTPSTREKFFEFVGHLRNLSQIQLSATIRLHQLKYVDETGVPPVDHGVLMFYNMGDLRSPNETNSILNLEEARKYVSNDMRYPLKLVPALPNFSWGVLFRNDKIQSILNNVSPDLYESSLFAKSAENEYECRERCFISGSWIYPGDLIRLESVEDALFMEAHQLLKKSITQFDEVIVYHLSNELSSRLPPDRLKDLLP